MVVHDPYFGESCFEYLDEVVTKLILQATVQVYVSYLSTVM